MFKKIHQCGLQGILIDISQIFFFLSACGCHIGSGTRQKANPIASIYLSHWVRNKTESESNRKHLLITLTDNPGTSEQGRETGRNRVTFRQHPTTNNWNTGV